MKISPKIGEVWFVDLDYSSKPRYYYVVTTPEGARLDLFSALQITTQYGGTALEVTLPRVPWLPEQSYINAQTIQPLKRSDFVRKANGQFDARVYSDVKAALKRWLKL